MQKTGQHKQLEAFGSQGSGGGWITGFCAGKTVESFWRDGTWLLIKFTDGHTARIGWQDIHGNQIKGDPFLENLDATVMLPSIVAGGQCPDL